MLGAAFLEETILVNLISMDLYAKVVNYFTKKTIWIILVKNVTHSKILSWNLLALWYFIWLIALSI